jgi:hypothetical protein
VTAIFKRLGIHSNLAYLVKKRYLIGLGLLILVLAAGCSLSLPFNSVTPTLTAIPRWEKFSGGGVELWLPERYSGGDPQSDLPATLEELRNLGAEYSSMADTISRNADLFDLWVFDTYTETPGFVTNVNVTRELAPEGYTLDQLMVSMEQQLSSSFNVLGIEKRQLSNYDTARFDLQLELPNVTVREIIYVFLEGGNVYALTYGTGIDEYEARLADFEQSAGTLHVIP